MSNGVKQFTAKVLVIEDYLVNQELTKEMLEMMGCEVDVADTGTDALELCEEANYDLILMDIQMPNMDGYQTTQEIRKMELEGKHTPIVAVTANAMQGDREKCISAGMDDYISKPFRKSDLEAILTQWTKQ